MLIGDLSSAFSQKCFYFVILSQFVIVTVKKIVLSFQVPFSSPLHGTINLKLTCLLEALIEEKGFLVSRPLSNWLFVHNKEIQTCTDTRLE